jgi:CRP/FNR family transcriptional regulator, dissimilatory nitrate respiration regulator
MVPAAIANLCRERLKTTNDTMTDDWANLSRAPLFRAMGAEITRALVGSRVARRYERGERIFQQGEPAEAFFFICEGWVKLFREREDGGEIVVAIFTAGQTFAETAMFLGGRFPASAETVSPARILRVEGATLRQTILKKPQLAFDMLAAASLHLKHLVHQIEQLKAQSAPQRIADFLLDQVNADSGAATIDLPYEKALIANRLGMQPESFSRALARLRRLGVTATREQVHIKDLARLAEFTARTVRQD